MDVITISLLIASIVHVLLTFHLFVQRVVRHEVSDLDMLPLYVIGFPRHLYFVLPFSQGFFVHISMECASIPFLKSFHPSLA